MTNPKALTRGHTYHYTGIEITYSFERINTYVFTIKQGSTSKQIELTHSQVIDLVTEINR
jgi:hypothetical protein